MAEGDVNNGMDVLAELAQELELEDDVVDSDDNDDNDDEELNFAYLMSMVEQANLSGAGAKLRIAMSRQADSTEQAMMIGNWSQIST